MVTLPSDCSKMLMPLVDCWSRLQPKAELGQKALVDASAHARAAAPASLFAIIFNSSIFKVSDQLRFNLAVLLDRR